MIRSSREGRILKVNMRGLLRRVPDSRYNTIGGGVTHLLLIHHAHKLVAELGMRSIIDVTPCLREEAD